MLYILWWFLFCYILAEASPAYSIMSCHVTSYHITYHISLLCISSLPHLLTFYWSVFCLSRIYTSHFVYRTLISAATVGNFPSDPAKCLLETKIPSFSKCWHLKDLLMSLNQCVINSEWLSNIKHKHPFDYLKLDLEFVFSSVCLCETLQFCLCIGSFTLCLSHNIHLLRVCNQFVLSKFAVSLTWFQKRLDHD